jgi:hypothetical protein
MADRMSAGDTGNPHQKGEVACTVARRAHQAKVSWGSSPVLVQVGDGTIFVMAFAQKSTEFSRTEKDTC